MRQRLGVLTVLNAGRVIFSGAVDDVRRRAPASVHVLRTSDDEAARLVAPAHIGVKVTAAIDGGLDVSADVASLDAYVIALGCAGIAVRALEHRVRPLESLFLELTGARSSTETAIASIRPAHVNQTSQEPAL